MKTKILFSILAFGFFISAFSQKPTIELTFTAENNGQNVPLDSIYIKNLTRDVDTTLYAPDTVLSLEFNTGVNDLDLLENTFSLSQNYPNPFKEKTTVNLYLPEKENVIITIRDVVGRGVAQYENSLTQGNHSFDFYPGNKKFYLLTVTGKHSSKTIKMLNNNPNFRGKCKIVYNSVANVIDFKSQNATNNFGFNLGDELRYIGYAKTVNEVNGSNVIEDVLETSENYVFEITEGIPCPENPYVIYEDQIYNTVIIGDQCWFKENLNVGTMIPSIDEMQHNGIFEKYCYDDNEDNCLEYGGLYQWNEMMQYSSIEGVKGICPEGWHLPCDDEWKILEGTADSQYGVGDPEWDNEGNRGYDAGKMLKSMTSWNSINGLNYYGFNAVPAGARYNGNTINLGIQGIFWTSSFWTSSENLSWGRGMDHFTSKIRRTYDNKNRGFSVRCLKD